MVAYFLPAVDVRSRHTGDVRYPGMRGWFWSSTPALTHTAWALWITSTFVDAGTPDHHHRVFGFSVRCVQRIYREKSGLNPSTFVLWD